MNKLCIFFCNKLLDKFLLSILFFLFILFDEGRKSVRCIDGPQETNDKIEIRGHKKERD